MIINNCREGKEGWKEKRSGRGGETQGGRGKEKNVGEKRGREVQGHGRRGRERCRKGEKRGVF